MFCFLIYFIFFNFQKERGHDVITTECNTDYAQNLLVYVSKLGCFGSHYRICALDI